MTTGDRLFCKEFLCFNTVPCRHMPLLVHFCKSPCLDAQRARPPRLGSNCDGTALAAATSDNAVCLLDLAEGVGTPDPNPRNLVNWCL